MGIFFRCVYGHAPAIAVAIKRLIVTRPALCGTGHSSSNGNGLWPNSTGGESWIGLFSRPQLLQYRLRGQRVVGVEWLRQLVAIHSHIRKQQEIGKGKGLCRVKSGNTYA